MTNITATRSNTTVMLKRGDVERLTLLSRSQIYALMKLGEFPTPIRLSSMSVAWIETEIHGWIANRIADSRKAA